MTTSPQWLEPPQLTKTFSTATLFVEQPAVRKGLPAFAVSLLLHGAALAIAILAFHAPRYRTSQRIPPGYSVRMIELQPPVIRQNLIARPQPLTTRQPESSAKSASSESQGLGPLIRHRQFELPVPARRTPAKQTLVQLDTPPKLAMNEAPVPDLLLWTPRDVPPPRKRLLPPPPQTVPKPARSLLAQPTLELPNREIKIADMAFAPPPVSTLPKLTAPPATTAPVKVNGPDEGSQVPQTVSAASTIETAAHIISLSNLPLRAEGVVAVPAANEVAASGHQQGQGTGQATSPGAGSGAGMTSARGNAGPGASAGSAASNLTTGAGSGSSTSSGSGSDEEASLLAALHKITLPKDGKFGVVVLGSTAADAYPDSVGLMTGKVIYTVYLKVGLRKSWILQYCLPGVVEQKFRAGGSATPLDAPWPFQILRPDLEIGPSIDALMVRGMINTEGHFEQLTLAMPSQFPQKELLLASLQKWEFRPAKRDQQPVAVEVLLIIPGEVE